ncbi:MAG TPA: hypothetical protein VIQ78_10095, partial [Terrimesophilobacter sp.]
MWNPDFGWGFGHGLIGIFANIVAGLAWILCLTVTIAVLFLLVRFLLVGTRAAQLYIARHEPQHPVAPATPASPVTPAAPAAARPDDNPAPTAPMAPSMPEASADPTVVLKPST